ncbi:mitochondrial import inner membrane translocase subunit Tim8 B [Sparus aurata]|uniref:Mitochondrial import inner membrane translocase subunit n=2 Tax=Sparus aurata TaxID=8175 RepID=A0A671UNF1_SPAAU|nr:mitochondrial import inner membrane translocase subunit Tim8 B [Sparus aurata]
MAEAAAAAVCAPSCDVYISGRYLTLLQRSLLVKPKVTSPPLAARQREYRGFLRPFNDTMDGFDNLNASEKAEATELQRMIAIEQQKAQFQAQVHTFTDVCWDKCVDSPGSKLDYRTETCLQSCVERFIDTTLTITNRFTQMVQKGAH